MVLKHALFLIFLLPSFLEAQEDTVDRVMVEKIKKEGLQRSEVMNLAWQLTEINGPRLTGSPGFDKAAQYAISQLSQWGLEKVRRDPFGAFGKGWELEKSYMAMTHPYYKPLFGLPRAWTKGTGGLQKGELLLIQAWDKTSLAPYKGKLKGKILILDPGVTYKHQLEQQAPRWTEAELQRMHAAPFTKSVTPNKSLVLPQKAPAQKQPAFQSLLNAMAIEEGAVAILNSNPNAREGAVIVGGLAGYRKDDPENLCDIMLSYEDYNSLLLLLKAKVPVRLEIETQARFYESDEQGYNVIAEIKGTDKNLGDEIVMLGAHLDSWHGSTGATDNAAGVAVMMEAVRILQAVGAKPRRTIRLALWGGEEQGLLGSKGYVRKTFMDSTNRAYLPAHQKLSVYFNLDNGGGKIRGIYLQGNAGVRPIFETWLQPFKDMGATTLTYEKGAGGTDHLSFLAVGLPAFQFIQDPLRNDKTHHTTIDSYNQLLAEDLKASAVVVASLVYHAAMREKLLPRQ